MIRHLGLFWHHLQHKEMVLSHVGFLPYLKYSLSYCHNQNEL